ncbi:MAG: Gfo/Idh/MocA family oxidoreductase [Candidatus Latescibacterota bacterium]|nr:Gfo/Idh/MocA family oxidoreductase [Candidatus Latescibacterota bacterium]
MSAIKAAVIGCGGAGSGHAQKAKDLGLELVGFCDEIEVKAAQLRERIGTGYATTDPGQIMRDERIDLVVVATHHDAHHPLALAAARAGKHLVVEKPMCVTREQAEELAEAVDRSGVKLVVNCKFRIAPTVQKARELIPHPRLSHGQLAMGNSGLDTGRGATWIWDADDGGWLLISTAVHTIDLLSYLMDSPADRVYAEGRVFGSDKGTAGFPDALVGTIQWQNGGLSTLISADQGQNSFVSKWFHQIWDGQRSAVFSAHTGRVDFGGCEIDHLETSALPAEEQQAASMMANLLEAIRTDGDTLCNAHDGVRTVALCKALEEAARSGRPQIVEH